MCVKLFCELNQYGVNRDDQYEANRDDLRLKSALLFWKKNAGIDKATM